MESPEYLKRSALEYFLGQSADDEEVVHLERVANERVGETEIDVWDVHTAENGRWWVISKPIMNLYRQEDIPSMDVALSFHLGLMQRVMTRQAPPASKSEVDRLRSAWRRWDRAHETLDEAHEAEDYQAVAMRCRECLLSLARELADAVPSDERKSDDPKDADFKGWAHLAAAHLAPGAGGERLRAYLRSTADAAWTFVSTRTHGQNSVRFDAQLSVDCTAHVLMAFGTALLKHEAGAPVRCPDCGSYRIYEDFRIDDDNQGLSPFVNLCEACGWEERSEPPDYWKSWKPHPADSPPPEVEGDCIIAEIRTFVTPSDVIERNRP
jgi:hypothetical protein